MIFIVMMMMSIVMIKVGLAKEHADRESVHCSNLKQCRSKNCHFFLQNTLILKVLYDDSVQTLKAMHAQVLAQHFVKHFLKAMQVLHKFESKYLKLMTIQRQSVIIGARLPSFMHTNYANYISV